MTKQESFCSLSITPLFWLLIIQSTFLCLHSNPEHRKTSNCIVSERAALLTFKSGLTDPANVLSSWVGEDCCQWWGVTCNNATHHVAELNFRQTSDEISVVDTRLGGEINPSLLHLKNLRRLDLSFNDFYGSSVPKFFGSLENLVYLDLSGAGFSGLVPSQLGNLSRLHYLDLSNNDFLYVDNLRWVSRLSSLKYLDMTLVNLTRAADWLQMLNMIPTLEFLSLELCGLSVFPSSLPYVNFTALKTLDLANNNLNNTLPPWLWSLRSLTNLNLYSCSLYGRISYAVGHLISLEVLHLGDNNLDGMIPMTVTSLCRLNSLDLSNNKLSGDIDGLVGKPWDCTEHRLQELRLSFNKLGGKLTSRVEQLASLTILDLRGNQLDGPIPVEIGKLQQLTDLDLSNNSLEGVVSEAHFANLTRLKTLFLSTNSLTMAVDESWVPPFQLKRIGLASCQLGPHFPSWLQHQREVSVLVLSNCGISGTVPEWFWKKFPPLINYLDLSTNKITGKLPRTLEFAPYSSVILSSNQFEGPLPPGLLSNAYALDLSDNSFSGPIPGIEVPYLGILTLAKNLFNSSIPSSLCKVMYSLDLSNNDLSGEVPDEWETEPPSYINLANNHISGRIPSSICSSTSNQTLSLSNNNFSGLFPKSLQACKCVTLLDLSQNKFFGNIPKWLGENLISLYFLSLRSNMFSGSIPSQLVQLQHLQTLDLADNNLSGPVPHWLGNFSAMTSTSEQDNVPDFSYVNYVTASVEDNGENSLSYYNSLSVFTKGEELKYTKNRYLVRSIDLSENNLRGEIPREIENLVELINLNLSTNRLNGRIPDNIGRMKSLESLDLSSNDLSGSIPLSISSLTSLSFLNLSYNHLSGRIPTGHQLQTLTDPSIYAGNTDLCGAPLLKNCSSGPSYEGSHRGYEDDGSGDEMVWVYCSVELGYAVGFCAVWGVLLLMKT